MSKRRVVVTGLEPLIRLVTLCKRLWMPFWPVKTE